MAEERFWYICPRCGSKASNGLCYGCGNNNIPDMSFENKPEVQLVGLYIYDQKEKGFVEYDNKNR